MKTIVCDRCSAPLVPRGHANRADYEIHVGYTSATAEAFTKNAFQAMKVYDVCQDCMRAFGAFMEPKK